MPYIPTETIVSAAILAALIAGWRYVQQTPQQEVIPASVKKTANAVLPGGKGLFEDELTGESGNKSSKAGSKKSASKKKKSVGTTGGAGAVSDGKEESSSSRAEQKQEQEAQTPAPAQTKAAKEKKPKTLAEKKVKKAPKTEGDE